MGGGVKLTLVALAIWLLFVFVKIINLLSTSLFIMKKILLNVIVLFVITVSVVTFVNMVSVSKVEAVSCPEGLICTPIASSNFVCPVGYTCTPTPPCPVGYTCIPKESQLVGCPTGYICKLTNGGSSSGGSVGSLAPYRFETNLTFGSLFSKKSTGADVVALQTWLIANGFDIPSITSRNAPKGTFDLDTKSAVIKYQKSIGIPDTGFVGPLTREALNESIVSKNPIISNQNQPKINNVAGKAAGNFEIDAGGSVGIMGINLAGYKDATNVYIGGKFCTITKLENNLIYCTAPSDLVVGNTYDLYINTVGIGGDKVTSNIVQVKVLSKVSTPRPSITVLSPNGGESYMQGSQVVVKWSTNNLDSSSNNVWIHLDTFDGKHLNNGDLVSSHVKNTGEKTIIIPSNIPVGKYKLAITAGQYFEDVSDNYFTITSNSPSPTPSPRNPSLNVTSPRSGEVWSIGDKKTITWSYADWNLGVFGNKYVDMYLVPMDGRSPMKLATNFNAPDGSVPVTIYERTSDGRPAWLPGRYKIRVVCNTNNVAPFNSCVNETDITIVSPTPTPTPAYNPTSMSDQDLLNANVWNAVRDYFNSQP